VFSNSNTRTASQYVLVVSEAESKPDAAPIALYLEAIAPVGKVIETKLKTLKFE
jgi:hypothetical protein